MCSLECIHFEGVENIFLRHLLLNSYAQKFFLIYIYLSPRDSESHKLTMFPCLLLNAEKENERKLQYYAAFHRQGKKRNMQLKDSDY